MRSFVLSLAFGVLACSGSAEEVLEPRAAFDSGAAPMDSGAIEDSVVAEDSAMTVEDVAPPPWSPALVDVAAPCGDAAEDVYRTPSLSGALPGDVVRCATDPALAEARVLRIAYRTQRSSGDAVASSARVYLPQKPHDGPLPIVVVGHPSEGLADGCAPSRREGTLKEIALPFAARGYAVIAPDLPGLGNEGTQAYLDNREQGYALLDAARALRKLLKDGALSDKIVLAGYSQGGGAVLSAQSLAASYGAGGTIVGVVAFAAQWPSRMESFGFVELLKRPDDLTVSLGYTKPVVAVLRTYAWFANTGRLAAGFAPASKRDAITSAVESLCLIPFGGALQARATRVRDFLDDELREGLLACIASTDDPRCTGTAREYHAFLAQNHLRADSKGAPILFVQGLLDTVMPVAEEAACNVAKLRSDGAPLTVCTDALASHANVVQRNTDVALQWVDSKLWGGAAPSCGDSLPACK